MARTIVTSPPGRHVSGTTFESVFKGLRPRLTDTLRASLADLGIDPGKALSAWYPESSWLKAIGLITSALYPEVGPDEARRQMGEALFAGFMDTIAGPVMRVLLKAIGPKRALFRTAENLRNGNNYAEVRVTENGQNDYSLWANTSYDSHWVSVGIMASGLRLAGAKNLVFEPIDRQPQEVLYRVKWDA